LSPGEQGPGNSPPPPCSLPADEAPRARTKLTPDAPYSHYVTEPSHQAPADATETVPATGVGVLDRIVAILDAVEAAPLGSSELARRLGITMPTAHRLVRAMVAHGLLRRDGRGRHFLGHRFAASALARDAEPALAEIARDTGESAQLWVRRGTVRLCVVSVESEQELRASLPAGMVVPLSQGGSAAEALLAPVPASCTRGWFQSVAARTPGLCSVSAPVWLNGEPVAAVCLSAPASRTAGEPGPQYGAAVVAVADRLEQGLSQG
jgi:DNA-binding IclR family transcriptional regulator